MELPRKGSSIFLKTFIMSKPLLVGLTGGIGSGKSTVSKVFKSLGVLTFNSDDIAKSIINNDAEVISSIMAEFGSVYEDGKLDKIKMSGIVFNDKEALEKLNKIVHPKVAEYFEKWVDDNSDEKILIKEAAILIESDAYKQMDQVILVSAPELLRLQRVVVRNNSSEKNVKSRIDAQLSDEEKKKYADFTIVNDEKQLVIPQILDIYHNLVFSKKD